MKMGLIFGITWEEDLLNEQNNEQWPKEESFQKGKYIGSGWGYQLKGLA